MDQSTLPKLIERNVRDYVCNSLNTCHENRVRKYSMIINILCFLFCLLSFLIAIYFSWKNRLTPEQIYEKQCRSHEYVKTKVRNHQIEMAQKQMSITKLPVLVNELRS